MYRAKSEGGNQFCLHVSDMDRCHRHALLRKTAMNGRNTDTERLRNGSRAMLVGGQSSDVA